MASTGQPQQGLSVAAPLAAQDIRDATLVKEADLFLLANLEGNVPPGNANGFGLYHRDTRFLSAYELYIQGVRPTLLLSSSRWHFLSAYVLTNPNFTDERGETVHEQTIQIRRYRVARTRRLSESLTFQSFNTRPLALEIRILVDADFADVFNVRGLTGAMQPRRIEAEHEGARVAFRYDGGDGLRRTTLVSFDPPPVRLAEGTATYRLELGERDARRITIDVDVEVEGQAAKAPPPPPPATRRSPARDEHTTVRTSNPLFDAVLERSRADLRALASGEGDGAYIAAGIPWYAALFGRDSLVTCLQDLWLAPEPVKRTLSLLARAQGKKDDPWRDEEPGKILHEARCGELSNAGVVPFGPYYGTVDATPLWILLLAEYERTSGDHELARALLPNLDAALGWIDRYGDVDGDGFVEYRRRSRGGLVNQGWKDSWDGIVNADGSIPEPPIALVEVQAYVYAAKARAAELFRALGDVDRARALDAEAKSLRECFDEAFWMPAEGYYCLALDGKKRQVRSITSNPGHALFCGIVPPARAQAVAERLMSEDLFSGWGVRTLSNREVRYNPVGYHLGTVWPHDNAIVALGFKRYGLEAHLNDIATGMFDASQHFPACRMPELFCGFARSAFGVPVRYPVACSPQAWAAGAWSMLLQAMLGTWPDATARELVIVRPTLPRWLDWVQVTGLRVGAGEVDLRYARVGDRTAADVVAMRGDVRVVFTDKWGGT
jgi:glycogen debranching enzyme